MSRVWLYCVELMRDIIYEWSLNRGSIPAHVPWINPNLKNGRKVSEMFWKVRNAPFLIYFGLESITFSKSLLFALQWFATIKYDNEFVQKIHNQFIKLSRVEIWVNSRKQFKLKINERSKFWAEWNPNEDHIWISDIWKIEMVWKVPNSNY